MAPKPVALNAPGLPLTGTIPRSSRSKKTGPTAAASRTLWPSRNAQTTARALLCVWILPRLLEEIAVAIQAPLKR
eukprot:8260159-Lingulodinium_polyedra.AAC.1